MVNDAGGAACGAAGKSTVVLASASCATLVPGGAERGSEDVNVGSALSSRVGVGAMCEAGAIGSGRAGEVDEAAGCTFSCVPSEMKVGSGLLGAAGITGGGGSGGVNAAGAAGTAGGGTTAGGAGATNETGAAGRSFIRRRRSWTLRRKMNAPISRLLVREFHFHVPLHIRKRAHFYHAANRVL